MASYSLPTRRRRRRCGHLLDAAKSRGIAIVVLHMGGEERRDALSNQLIELAAPRAHRLIIREDSDVDGLFAKIAADNKIPLAVIDNVTSLKQPLQRRDRPLRTRRFLEFLAAREPAPIVFVAGDPLALLLARRAGFKRQAVRRLRGRTAAAALAELAAPASAGAVIWGVGNYRGIGARLIAQLQAPTLPSPARGGG